MDMYPGPKETWRVKVLPQWRSFKPPKEPEELICEDCKLPIAMPSPEEKNEVKIVKKEQKKKEQRIILFFRKKKPCPKCTEEAPTFGSLCASINLNCCKCVKVLARYLRDVLRFVTE